MPSRVLKFEPLHVRKVGGYTSAEKKYLWRLHVSLLNSAVRHGYNKTLQKKGRAYDAAFQWYQWGWRIGRRVQQQVIHKVYLKR